MNKKFLISIKKGVVSEIKEYPSLEEAASAMKQSPDGETDGFTMSAPDAQSLGYKVGDKYDHENEWGDGSPDRD